MNKSSHKNLIASGIVLFILFVVWSIYSFSLHLSGWLAILDIVVCLAMLILSISAFVIYFLLRRRAL